MFSSMVVPVLKTFDTCVFQTAHSLHRNKNPQGDSTTAKNDKTTLRMRHCPTIFNSPLLPKISDTSAILKHHLFFGGCRPCVFLKTVISVRMR